MTREEAIGFGKMWLDINSDAKDSLTYKFFERALEVLKAEPCEDCVSRETVLNTLDTMDAVLDENRTVESYKELLKECYKELPPVTPKPRTGKWIKVVTETDSFGNETYHHECSVCKCNKSGWGEYRFCPNCGAKMEGESE